MDPHIWTALENAYPAPAPKTLRQLYAERAALAVTIPSDQHDHPEAYKALQRTIAQVERRFAAAWERADGHRPFANFTEESMHYFEHPPRQGKTPVLVPDNPLPASWKLPLRRVVDLRETSEGFVELLDCNHYGALIPPFLKDAMLEVYKQPGYVVWCIACTLSPQGDKHEDQEQQ